VFENDVNARASVPLRSYAPTNSHI